MIVEKPYKDTDEVCTCVGLTAGHIRELVENGAASIEEVLEKTGAGTICGECTGIAVAVAREFMGSLPGCGVRREVCSGRAPTDPKLNRYRY